MYPIQADSIWETLLFVFLVPEERHQINLDKEHGLSLIIFLHWHWICSELQIFHASQANARCRVHICTWNNRQCHFHILTWQMPRVHRIISEIRKLSPFSLNWYKCGPFLHFTVQMTLGNSVTVGISKLNIALVFVFGYLHMSWFYDCSHNNALILLSLKSKFHILQVLSKMTSCVMMSLQR